MLFSIIAFCTSIIYPNVISKNTVGNLDLEEKQGRVTDANVIDGVLRLDVAGYDCWFVTDAPEQMDYEALIGEHVYFSIRKQESRYFENQSKQIVFHTLRTNNETIIPYNANRSIFLQSTRDFLAQTSVMMNIILLVVAGKFVVASFLIHAPFIDRRKKS